MSKVRTMEEIKARYAPDWVIIAEPQTDEMLRVLGGKVILHGPDRNELLLKARELKLNRWAIRYLSEYLNDIILLI